MNVGQVLLKLGRVLSYVLLFLTALILLCWPLIEVLVAPSVQPTQLVGLVVGLIGFLTIDFYVLLSSFRPGSMVHLEHATIAGGIRLALEKEKHVRHLRVFASTTEVILPIIRDSGITIDTCHVMVQQFDTTSGDPKPALLNRKVQGFIDTWKDMTKQGIKDIVIKRYDFIPSQYIIIFDDRYLVVGLFIPTDLTAHAVDYLQPFVVDETTASGMALIQKYIRYFDLIFGKYQPV